MFQFLKQVDDVVQQILKSGVRRIQPLTVDQQLANLEFVKDGYTTIVLKLKPFQLHTWAEYGQDPQMVAERLLTQLDTAMTAMNRDKLILYVSPVYMDYTKGQFYDRGITLMLQCVVYQYDGTTLTTLERETDYHELEFVRTEHTLTEYVATKIRVWPRVIERDFNINEQSKFKLSVTDLENQILEPFIEATALGRTLIQKTLHVLYCQKRIEEKLGEGNYASAAVLLQEMLGVDVTYVEVGLADSENDGDNPRFIIDGEHHDPDALINKARATIYLPPVHGRSPKVSQ